METNSSISQCQECCLYGWTLEQKHMNVIKVEYFFPSAYFCVVFLEYMIERAVEYIYCSLFKLIILGNMEMRK